jgi:hypothetical protein
MTGTAATLTLRVHSVSQITVSASPSTASPSTAPIGV